MTQDVADITVEILKDIRAELRSHGEILKSHGNQLHGLHEELHGFRQDTNARFERLEADVRAIVSHFERDYMSLSDKVGTLEQRFDSHLSRHP